MLVPFIDLICSIEINLVRSIEHSFILFLRWVLLIGGAHIFILLHRFSLFNIFGSPPRNLLTHQPSSHRLQSGLLERVRDNLLPKDGVRSISIDALIPTLQSVSPICGVHSFRSELCWLIPLNILVVVLVILWVQTVKLVNIKYLDQIVFQILDHLILLIG